MSADADAVREIVRDELTELLDDVDDERIAELAKESQGGRRSDLLGRISRRGLLKAGAAGIGGGLIGSQTAQAAGENFGAATGEVGTDSAPLDEANIRDIDGLRLSTRFNDGTVVANSWLDDGSANNILEAIQLATQFVANNGRADVLIRPGSYTVSSGSVSVPAGFARAAITSFSGSPSVEIDYSGSGPVFDLTNGLQNHVSISGLEITDTGGSASEAIKASDMFAFKIANCRFDEFQSYQVNLTGNTDFVLSTHNDYRSCNGNAALGARAATANNSVRSDIIVSYEDIITDTSSGCHGILFSSESSTLNGAFVHHTQFDTVRSHGVLFLGVTGGQVTGISSEGTGTASKGFTVEDNANSENSVGVTFRECFINGSGRSPDTGVSIVHGDRCGVVGGRIEGHASESVAASGVANNCFVNRVSLANGVTLSSGAGHTRNGVGEEASSGVPSSSIWTTGDVVEDTNNQGNVYMLLPSGIWARLA